MVPFFFFYMMTFSFQLDPCSGRFYRQRAFGQAVPCSQVFPLPSPEALKRILPRPPPARVFESEISRERSLRLAVVMERGEGEIVNVDPYVPSPVRLIARIVVHLVKGIRRR